MIARRPHVVHLNCGAHDLRHDRDGQGPLVPQADYEANLTAIFERLGAETDADLVWATITPLIEERHHAVRNALRYERDVAAYNAIGLSVARRFGAGINDLHAAVSEAGRERLLTDDGLHFTEEGYALLARRLRMRCGRRRLTTDGRSGLLRPAPGR